MAASFLDLRLISYLCLCLYIAFSSMSVFSSVCIFKRIPVIGFKAHQDNIEWYPHLKSLPQLHLQTPPPFFFFNTNQATLTCYFRELRHEHTFVGAIIQSTTVVLSFPGGSVVKNLSPAQETQVQFLSREDFLEKEMTTHCNIPAWRIPWTEEPGRL